MSLVLDSPMQNIAFVKEIERHSCIYNCHIPEYNRKEITDAAWAEIAKKMKSTVLNCKEKWRNLRTVFIRKEKLRAKKYTRPYYLTPHLKFLLPFIKLRSGETLPEEIEETGSNASENIGTTSQEGLEDHDVLDTDDQNDTVEEKYSDHQFVGVFTDEGEMLLPYDSSGGNNTVASTSSFSKKRKVSEYKKTRNTFETEYFEEAKNDPKWCFLMSLLPDIREMNSGQMRAFKRGVLDLVDSILEEES